MQDIRRFASESVETLTFGYVFRSDSVAEEVNAVKKVIERYMPLLETGMADDVDELLDVFLAELDDAGIGRIIEENQKQLDEWLKEKKS